MQQLADLAAEWWLALVGGLVLVLFGVFVVTCIGGLAEGDPGKASTAALCAAAVGWVVVKVGQAFEEEGI